MIAMGDREQHSSLSPIAITIYHLLDNNLNRARQVGTLAISETDPEK
jgi:hypothetical protein